MDELTEFKNRSVEFTDRRKLVMVNENNVKTGEVKYAYILRDEGQEYEAGTQLNADRLNKMVDFVKSANDAAEQAQTAAGQARTESISANLKSDSAMSAAANAILSVQKFNSLSASAKTSADGSARAEVSDSGNGVKFAFEIPQGQQGAQGPQGIQGVQGPLGAQGIKGDKGETGSAGPQGQKGDDGNKGDRGDSGILVPSNGFFVMYVDVDGNLRCKSSESSCPITYDAVTGNLIYSII